MQRSFIFSGGNSTRFHTVDVHNRQCIGNHSFGVAWLCELITQGAASKNLIMAALAHDLAEHVVGDVPAPAKRSMGIGKLYEAAEYIQLSQAGLSPYFDKLTPLESEVLKLSDCFEGMIFCLRERKLGNRNVDDIFGRYVSYVSEVITKMETSTVAVKAARILDELGSEWKELTK